MRKVIAALTVLTTFCWSGLSYAQTWPTRSLTLIIPFAAGGATDAIGRALANRMSQGLGQPVIVVNRTGAAGAIGANAVAKATPDGYTILMATTSTHAILPLTQDKLEYNPITDFAEIGLVAIAPNILIVSPKVSANSVTELIAFAKQNPGKINFASSGQGTITHLIGELFVMEAGIQAVHVPYKSGVQSFTDLSDGRVQFLFDSIVWSLPQIRAGKLKGLGITSAKRSQLAPEMPTIAESGLPNFEGSTWFGLSAPARTPEPVLARLQKELKAALEDKELAKRLAVLGAEPAYMSGSDFAKMIGEDTEKWRSVISRAGVKMQ